MSVIVIAAIFFLLLFVVIEYGKRRFDLQAEVSRKLVHIGAAVMSAALPLVMNFEQIIIIGILFLGFLLISKQVNLFPSIHGVKRKTYGEIYFPIAVSLMAYFFPSNLLYMHGLLIMGFSDGLAGLSGQHYGTRKYVILSKQKSYVGSGAFLFSAWLISFISLLISGANPMPALLLGLLLGITVTGVEASLTTGLDNLVVPLVASTALLQCLYFLGLR